MLVVSDASPINVLVRTALVDVLPALYETIVIPAAVIAEMSDARAPEPIRKFVAAQPRWLSVRSPVTLLDLAGLDPGERAAISLGTDFSISDEILKAALERDAQRRAT
jgi:predicted nucleic acid-binding protein